MPTLEQETLARVSGKATETLRALLEREIRAQGMSPLEARAYLRTVLPEIGGQFEAMASSLALDAYDVQRAERGLTRRVPYTGVPAEPASDRRWETLANWAFKEAADPESLDDVFTLIEGGFQRTIADAHRRTIMLNAISDPASRGWSRVGRGAKTCDFCQMLIGRGDVYSLQTVKFKSHDHCDCAAESKWESLDTAEMKAWAESKSKRTMSMRRLDARQRELAAIPPAARTREQNAELAKLAKRFSKTTRIGEHNARARIYMRGMGD